LDRWDEEAHVNDDAGMSERPLDLDPEVAALLVDELVQAADQTVFILPTRLNEGRGVYDESLVTAAKEMRAAGAPAQFLHSDPADRVFAGDFSAEIAIAFVVGIMSNLTYDTAKGVCTYLLAAAGRRSTREGADPTVSVGIKRLKTRDGVEVDGIKITGPSTEVVDRVLSALMGRSDD
jgi:hypothetical protein